MLLRQRNFQEALSLIEERASGKIYVVGGRVYRTIIAANSIVNGVENSDIDIVVENWNPKNTPDGFELTTTSLGSPRYKRNGVQIDIMPLTRQDGSTDVAVNIEEFLELAAFDLQRGAFDLESKHVIDGGMFRAISNCEVKPYNHFMLAKYAAGRNITPQMLLEERAKSVGFRAVWKDQKV